MQVAVMDMVMYTGSIIYWITAAEWNIVIQIIFSSPAIISKIKNYLTNSLFIFLVINYICYFQTMWLYFTIVVAQYIASAIFYSKWGLYMY